MANVSIIQGYNVKDAYARDQINMMTGGLSTRYVETDITNITTKYTNYLSNVSNLTDPELFITPNNSYDSYIMFADRNYDVYVAGDYEYYSLSILTNPTGDELLWQDTLGYIFGDSVVRLRNFEETLPTELNPLTITAGTCICITVKTNVIPKLYIKTYVSPAHSQITLNTTDTNVTISGDNYSVSIDKLTTTQGYEWNITSIKCSAKTNIIPTGTDVIGVLQIQGENNFIGGLHGNEENIIFNILTGGKSVINQNGNYSELTVVMVSHLYDVVDPSLNVVDRYVTLTFTPTGWISNVTFKMLDDVTVQNAYSGMFGFYKNSTNGCYTNLGALNLNETNRQFESTKFNEAIINLSDDSTVNMIGLDLIDGFVDYRDSNDSFKIYNRCSHLETLNSGDYIGGITEYRFS